MVVIVTEHEVAVEHIAVRVDEVDVVDQPLERLRLAQPGADLGIGAGVLVGGAHARLFLTGLHGDALVLGGDLGVVDLDVLGGGDRAQGEVEPDGLLGLGSQPFDEGVAVLAGGRQELIDGDAARGQLPHRGVDAAAEVRLHECGGRLDVGELHQLCGGAPDQLAAGPVQLGIGEALTDAVGPGGDRVVLPDVLGRPTRR